MIRRTCTRYITLAAAFLPIVVGCGDTEKQVDGKSNAAAMSGADAEDQEDANGGDPQKNDYGKINAAKSGADAEGQTHANGGDLQKNQGGATAIETVALRLKGEWKGGGVIVDEKALRRYAEAENTEAEYPDAAERDKAIEETITSMQDLYGEMTHVLVFDNDGSYTKTSWGTGAYSDGKPQKGTWRITKAADDEADLTLTISGRDVPYVADFSNGELTLQVSKSMPRYSDINRALGERYKKRSSSPGKNAK